MELYFHSPNTSSWRGAQLNHRDNFTFTLPHSADNGKITYILQLASVEQGTFPKLTVVQLAKKFPNFCGTLRSISVFKRDRHWSLS
jgi:hypothetical protein